MLIKWLKDIEKGDFPLIGEKASILSRLQESGIQVPHGFVLSTQFYDLFLQETGLNLRLQELKDIDKSDEELLQEKIIEIQELIIEAEMPFSLKQHILEAYNNLNVNLDIYKLANKPTINMIKAGRDLPYVAVRTSLNNNSVFENPSTFLNVKGNNNTISTIQKCYASILTRNFVSDFNNLANIKPAIIIQKMVNSQVSGIATTEESSIVIKAALGLAESILTNTISSDYYTLNRNTFEILNRTVNNQTIMLTKDDITGKTIKKIINDPRAYSQKLIDYDILNIAKITSKIEPIFNSNVELEFAIENSRIYIIQAKPLTNSSLNKPLIKEDNTQTSNILEDMPIITPDDIIDSKDINDYYSKLEQSTPDEYKKNLPIKILTNDNEFSWIIKHDLDWDIVETVLRTIKEKWKQHN